jgi:membrane protease YdiL (CAAX protease family)
MKTVLNIVWNSKEHRLRALIRILIQILFMFFLTGFSAFIFVPVFRISQLTGNTILMNTVSSLSSLFGILVSVWISGRFLDHRGFREYGFHFDSNWWRDFSFGIFLGAFLMTGIFIAELSAGWINIKGTFAAQTEGMAFSDGLTLALLLFICVGIQEELLFRGYLLRNIAEGLNFPKIRETIALILSWSLTSIIFGLSHIANPNASLTSTFYIILAGIFLGLGFVLTGELAIPIGLHISWNLFQGIIFGFPVSGLKPFVSIFQTSQSGPILWTGGAFGPEAGLIGVVAIIIGSGIIIVWVWHNRHRISLKEELANYSIYNKNID